MHCCTVFQVSVVGMRRAGTVDKVTRAIMGIVMTKKLGKLYNWRNQRGDKLPMVENKTFVKAMLGNV